MNTVSAPSGIGAPVKIRTAWPGWTGLAAEAPAWTRPVDRKCLLLASAADRGSRTA